VLANVTDKRELKAARQAAEAEAKRAQTEADRLGQLETRFWESPYGQARSAKIAGKRYFQIELQLDATRQTNYSRVVIDAAGRTQRYGGQGTVLSNIEKEGWELIHAGFVFKEEGQVSRDKLLSSGQQVATWGATYGVYLFRTTDKRARTDEYWRNW
jgi:hypothetical protein